MNMKWITRNAAPAPVITDDDGATRISAVVTSSRVDVYGDRVTPEALQKWHRLQQSRPALPMLREHDRISVAGAWEEFELEEDESDGALLLRARGLVVPKFVAGREAQLLIDYGFVRATSIGAFIGDIRRAPGANHYNIGEIEILEVSLVLWAGNVDAIIDRSEREPEPDFFADLNRYMEAA